MGVLLIKDNQYGGPIDQRQPVWGSYWSRTTNMGGSYLSRVTSMGVLLIKDDQYWGPIDQGRPVWGVLLIKDDQYGESY